MQMVPAPQNHHGEVRPQHGTGAARRRLARGVAAKYLDILLEFESAPDFNHKPVTNCVRRFPSDFFLFFFFPQPCSSQPPAHTEASPSV